MRRKGKNRETKEQTPKKRLKAIRKEVWSELRAWVQN